MKRRYSKFFPIAFLLFDLISLNLGVVLANLVRFDQLFYFENQYTTLHIFSQACLDVIILENKPFLLQIKA